VLAHVGVVFVEKMMLICSLKIGKLKDYQSKDFLIAGLILWAKDTGNFMFYAVKFLAWKKLKS
jgi:hypothetical protein